MNGALSGMTNMWRVSDPPIAVWSQFTSSDPARNDSEQQPLLQENGIVSEEQPTPTDTSIPPPRKRGRPPGSLNKATLAKQQQENAEAGPSSLTSEPPVKRGRGRPPGSKNKTKLGLPVSEMNGQPLLKRPRARSNGSKSAYGYHDMPDHSADEPDSHEIASTHNPSSYPNGTTSLPVQQSGSRSNAVSTEKCFVHDPDINSALLSAPSRAALVSIDMHVHVDASIFLSLSENVDVGTSSSPQKHIPNDVKACIQSSLNVYLRPKPGTDTPRLYSVLKTFWTPQESGVFDRAPSDGSPIPSDLRFFLWDPLPLAQGCIVCPSQGCVDKLKRDGDKKDVLKIVDVINQYWLIGIQYKCTTCANRSVIPSSWTSWHPPILASLPQHVAAEFPLRLVQDKWIDKNLYELIETAYSQGLGGKYIVDVLQARRGKSQARHSPAINRSLLTHIESSDHASAQVVVGLNSSHSAIPVEEVDMLPRAPPEQPPLTSSIGADLSAVDNNLSRNVQTYNAVNSSSVNQTPMPLEHHAVSNLDTGIQSNNSSILNGHVRSYNGATATIPPLERPVQSRPVWKQPPMRLTSNPATASPRSQQGSPLLSVQRQPLLLSQPEIVQAQPIVQIIRTTPRQGVNHSRDQHQSPNQQPSTSKSSSFEIIESTDIHSEVGAAAATRSRKPRSCRRCGRVGVSVAGGADDGCPGASDIRHCKNACRDCGSFDCSGRDPKKWKGRTRCENYNPPHNEQPSTVAPEQDFSSLLQ